MNTTTSRLARFLGRAGRRMRNGVNILGRAGLFGILFTSASAAAPIILNQPFSANPGDIVSIVGSGFGTAPHLYFKPSRQAAATELQIIQGQNALVEFRVPQKAAWDLYEIWVSNGSSSSAHVLINAPRAMQFDNPDIASGGTFRIFGRNLYVNGVTPQVTFIDSQTKASLNATVNFSGPNDAYRLFLTAPSGIVPGRTYQVTVSNGYASTTADQTLLGHATGFDHFGTYTVWGTEFIYQNGPNYRPGTAGSNESDHHVYDVTSDPALTVHAKGDGATDATAAIQNAINLASQHGGGVVYFPAGVYRLGSTTGLLLKSGVVLQGHSNADTKIVFGPTSPQGSSYSFMAFYWPAGAQLSGIADLSLQNVDKTSQVVVNANSGGNTSKIFLARLNWDLGSGKSIYLTGDRVTVIASTFTQAKNSQLPYPDGNCGIGPFYITQISNFSLRNNTISWFTQQNLINNVTNAIIETNHFTRNADEIVATAAQTAWPYVNKSIAVGDVVERTSGRQLAINFGKNVVLHSNIFDTAGDALKYNWDDGETIQSEGGGSNPEADTGTVTAASALTITDNSRCSGSCAWNYYPGAVVSVVSGVGAGQIRHIVSRSNNTFTIDQPWDITPAPGDHFAIDVPSFENVLIRYNTMTGNPLGVVMYGGTFLNVSVVGNTLTDNGGIILGPRQNAAAGQPNGATFLLRRMRNIEINSNTLTNTKALYGSYIFVSYAIVAKNSFWGVSADGLEIRSNKVNGHPGTPSFASAEGYFNDAYYQSASNSGNYVEQGTNAVVGAIFQGNSCVNCPTAFTVSTGMLGTVIWNSAMTASAGMKTSPLSDFIFANTATHASTATTFGHD